MPLAARERFEKELTIGRLSDDPDTAWAALSTAHILSQPWAGPHVRSHLAMLGQAVKQRDVGEVLAQVLRTTVAAPGSWVGRIPVGNTGRGDMALMATQAVPPDLAALLEAGDA
jgi:hypothetical protein